jgi:hypothetical protein
MSVKDYVKGQSEFTYYRAGNLWFKTDNGFEFPVPCDDLDSATVTSSMKSLTLMRWIRKHLATLENGGDAA